MGMKRQYRFLSVFLAGTTTSTLGVGATLGLSAINGGAPSSGGQISSTWEPRILQFGLKILY
jgi:hypothetical protein